MKKKLLLLLFIPYMSFGQLRLPYISLLHAYHGDTIKQSFSGDSAKWYTNKSYFSFSKPIYVQGTLIGGTTPSSTFNRIKVGTGNDTTIINTDGTIHQYYNGSEVFYTTNKGYIGINGGYNTAIGSESLEVNTTGSYNTALGNGALANNINGSGNTAIGAGSLLTNVDGGTNIAIGSSSLGLNESGSSNIAIGYQTIINNTTGNNNLAIGENSLSANITGVNNMALGYRSGQHANLSNRLYISSLINNSLLEDTTKGIIYGLQDATVSNQKLYLNANLFVKGKYYQNTTTTIDDTASLMLLGNNGASELKVGGNGYIYNQAPHAFSKFMDSTITISLTQNTWYQITRPVAKTTWPTTEFYGFTDTGDTITAQYKGHYIIVYQINIAGSDNKTYEYRIMRKNGTSSEVWKFAVASNGTQVLRDVSTYIDLEVGTQTWVEIRSTSSAPGSVTINGGQLRIYPIHLYL